jgi:hypothetical protein
MSKVYTGTTTNNVTELTLQEEGVGNIGTQTIVWDSAQGTIDQVIGAIPDNWKQNGNTLKQLQIGSSCTTIGSSAFLNCTGLTGSLTIPNSVTTIGIQAFDSCSGLTGSLTIPNSVTSIGSQAFYNADGFTGDLVIPNSVTNIGDYAFGNGLAFNGSLTIPDSVTSIGSYAFYYCNILTAVYTNCPASSFTGSAAFYGTTFTTIYTGPNATGYTATFQGRTGLTIAPWTNYPTIP